MGVTGKMGSFKASDLKKLQKQLEGLKDKSESFSEDCAKELAARVLGKVKKRTLPGKYSDTVEFDANIPEKQVEFTTKKGKHVSFKAKARKKHVKFTVKTGKKGGTLRRSWTVSPISHVNGKTVIEVINPAEYASYYEYGHRTANHKGWVQGKFVLTKSEEEVQKIAPKVIEAKIKKILGDELK